LVKPGKKRGLNPKRKKNLKKESGLDFSAGGTMAWRRVDGCGMIYGFFMPAQRGELEKNGGIKEEEDTPGDRK